MSSGVDRSVEFSPPTNDTDWDILMNGAFAEVPLTVSRLEALIGCDAASSAELLEALRETGVETIGGLVRVARSGLPSASPGAEGAWKRSRTTAISLLSHLSHMKHTMECARIARRNAELEEIKAEQSLDPLERLGGFSVRAVLAEENEARSLGTWSDPSVSTAAASERGLSWATRFDAEAKHAILEWSVEELGRFLDESHDVTFSPELRNSIAGQPVLETVLSRRASVVTGVLLQNSQSRTRSSVREPDVRFAVLQTLHAVQAAFRDPLERKDAVARNDAAWRTIRDLLASVRYASTFAGSSRLLAGFFEHDLSVNLCFALKAGVLLDDANPAETSLSSADYDVSSVVVEVRVDEAVPGRADETSEVLHTTRTSSAEYGQRGGGEGKPRKMRWNPWAQLLARCVATSTPCGILTTHDRWAFARVGVSETGEVHARVTPFYSVNDRIFGKSMRETLMRFSLAASRVDRLRPCPAFYELFRLSAPATRECIARPPEEDGSPPSAAGSTPPPSFIFHEDDASASLQSVADRFEAQLHSCPEFQAFLYESPVHAWKHKVGLWLLSGLGERPRREAARDASSEGFPFSYLELAPSLMDPSRRDEDAPAICADSTMGCVVRSRLNGRDCACKVLFCAPRNSTPVPEFQEVMIHEAEVYERLKELQRTGEIPTVHGLFRVAMGFAWVLVLSYEGVTLEDDVGPIGYEDGCEMRRILARVHESGVLHGRMVFQSFVRSESGKIALLDFKRAELRSAGDDDERWARKTSKERLTLDEMLRRKGWTDQGTATANPKAVVVDS